MAENTIALQTMLPKIDSQFDVEAGAQKIRQMQQATQQGAYQQQQQAQAQADDASYRQALQSSGGDNARMLSTLAGTGNYAGYAKAQAADLALRKGNADIDKDKATTTKTQFDTLHAANGMVGSAAGALAQKPTYENAVTIVGQLKQRLGPEMSQHLGLDTLEIPRDPAQIAAWAQQHYMASIETDKQLTDARTKSEGEANRGVQVQINTANNNRIASEGRANRANQIAVQDRMTSRQSDRLDGPEASLSPKTIARLAEMEIGGDSSGRAGLGRGAQGAANLTALQNAITEMGAERGISGRDITAARANLEGLRTGMRATGNISARVENAAEEAAQLAPLALDASRQVARSGFLPFGKAQVMFNTQTNDPAMAKFATANLGLATAYASAMARGNKPTVSDNEHARALLAEAQSQPAYEAKVSQMMTEIEAAKRAPRAVRDSLQGEINGKKGAAPTPNANSKGWALHVDASGNKAYVSPDGKQFEEVK